MGLKDYLTFSKNFQRVGDKRHAKKKRNPLWGDYGWFLENHVCLGIKDWQNKSNPTIIFVIKEKRLADKRVWEYGRENKTLLKYAKNCFHH